MLYKITFILFKIFLLFRSLIILCERHCNYLNLKNNSLHMSNDVHIDNLRDNIDNRTH